MNTAAALVPVTSESAAISLPALIDRAVSALANARTAAEVLDARDLASVAYDAAKKAARLGKAKQAHDDLLAAAYRAQANAAEIEFRAKRRLADEYDAAQERGEVARIGDNLPSVPDGNSKATAADLGISRKEIHEARMIRDAEEASPGVVHRTVDEALEAGEEPTKAKIRRAVLTIVKPTAAAPRLASGLDAICGRVREAFSTLAGLPPAIELARHYRKSDAGVLVAEQLPAVVQWINEFSKAWEETAHADEGR